MRQGGFRDYVCAGVATLEFKKKKITRKEVLNTPSRAPAYPADSAAKEQKPTELVSQRTESNNGLFASLRRAAAAST